MVRGIKKDGPAPLFHGRGCPQAHEHSSESWNPGGVARVGHFVSEKGTEAIFVLALRQRDCFVAPLTAMIA